MFKTIKYLVRLAAHDAQCYGGDKQWFYELCTFYAKIIAKSGTPLSKLKFGLELENELSIQVVYWTQHRESLEYYNYENLIHELFDKLNNEIARDVMLTSIINKHKSNILNYFYEH